MPRNIGLPTATDNSRDRDRGAIVTVPMRSSLHSPTQQDTIHGEAILDIISDYLRRPWAAHGARRRPANRRDPQILSSRQPCEHVDPRGGDDLDRGADDGRL